MKSLTRWCGSTAALLAAGVMVCFGTGAQAAAPQPNIGINDVTVTEGVNATAVFTVSIDRAPAKNRDITVQVATANGSATAGSDYTATSSTLTFVRGGALTQTFSVPIRPDNTVAEPTRTFNVVLSNAQNGVIADSTGVGTILDNDTAPTLSIGNASVTEGNTGQSTMHFTVTLSAPAPTGGVNFNVSTINGTGATGATAPSDFVAITNSARSIAANATGATIDVTINGDTTVEQNETFTVSLTGITNTTNTTASATGTIVNDDLAVGGGDPGRSTKSINSTSQSCGQPGQPNCGATDVGEQAVVPGTTHKVLAVNDLGMHCGDLDTRISSILPPFNVLRAVVVQTGPVPTKNPAGVSVTYSAASNPNDPFFTTPRSVIKTGGGVYKTNFWDIGQAAYDPFYPGKDFVYPPLNHPLNPFAPPYNLTMPVDQSLPMPDAEQFYLGSGALEFNQQPMPGLGSPYALNTAKTFMLQVATQPFFNTFAFGYTSNVNWWTAEGVPISAFDDNGRENPYPLMRVAAVSNTGTVLATTDTVIPISGEANCQACHAAPADGGNGAATTAITGFPVPVTSIEDPNWDHVPQSVSVEWASDHNILKLHDMRNGTKLITDTTEDFPNNGATQFNPVVCQTCHYTPALDLAQLGPLPLDPSQIALANGRQQGNNQSMSRVMHNHHGQLTSLFPPMPAPVQDANGVITNQGTLPNPAAGTRLDVLDKTCYMCHPGQRTKCLRGAMSNGGMLCQDCHGNMTDVGNDFSKKLPSNPAGQFILANNFYDASSTTPRVPWANEPSCGSCHTGDAVSNLAGTTGTIVNTRDVYKRTGTPATGTPDGNNNLGNADNIRLLQAFRTGTGDTKKTPIVPTNKRFAENTVANTPGDGTTGSDNPKLYRVSVDNHGASNGGGSGIFCEACHGATHSEWPNANPLANDNVTANQLQNHTGVISECSVCHGSANLTFPSTNGVVDPRILDGPHGLHVIGSNSPFASSSIHRQAFTNGNYTDTEYRAKCQACHGGTSRSTSPGTVLSRAQGPRSLRGVAVAAGTPIGCHRSGCH